MTPTYNNKSSASKRVLYVQLQQGTQKRQVGRSVIIINKKGGSSSIGLFPQWTPKKRRSCNKPNWKYRIRVRKGVSLSTAFYVLSKGKSKKYANRNFVGIISPHPIPSNLKVSYNRFPDKESRFFIKTQCKTLAIVEMRHNLSKSVC